MTGTALLRLAPAVLTSFGLQVSLPYCEQMTGSCPVKTASLLVRGSDSGRGGNSSGHLLGGLARWQSLRPGLQLHTPPCTEGT